MGPRPRGRGIPDGLTIDTVDPTASMGQRPRGRGIETDGNTTDYTVIASMGPRPRGRGISANKEANWGGLVLQWGRDHAVAESGVQLAADAANLGASMGPRPRG